MSRARLSQTWALTQPSWSVLQCLHSRLVIAEVTTDLKLNGVHALLWSQAALERLEFTRPSGIQAAGIPVVLGGSNVALQSYTGSGKVKPQQAAASRLNPTQWIAEAARKRCHLPVHCAVLCSADPGVHVTSAYHGAGSRRAYLQGGGRQGGARAGTQPRQTHTHTIVHTYIHACVCVVCMWVCVHTY